MSKLGDVAGDILNTLWWGVKLFVLLLISVMAAAIAGNFGVAIAVFAIGAIAMAFWSLLS